MPTTWKVSCRRVSAQRGWVENEVAWVPHSLWSVKLDRDRLWQMLTLLGILLLLFRSTLPRYCIMLVQNAVTPWFSFECLINVLAQILLFILPQPFLFLSHLYLIPLFPAVSCFAFHTFPPSFLSCSSLFPSNVNKPVDPQRSTALCFLACPEVLPPSSGPFPALWYPHRAPRTPERLHAPTGMDLRYLGLQPVIFPGRDLLPLCWLNGKGAGRHPWPSG